MGTRVPRTTNAHQTHTTYATITPMPTRGSTPRFTALVRAAFLDRLRDGDGRVSAAHALGIAPSTYTRYVRAHPDFLDEMVTAERTFDGKVQRAVAEHALEDWRAGVRWLEARERDRWSPARTVATVDLSAQRVEHAHQSPAEIVDTVAALERAGARPAGTAELLRAFFVASGELPAPEPVVLELVEAAEVVDDDASGPLAAHREGVSA